MYIEIYRMYLISDKISGRRANLFPETYIACRRDAVPRNPFMQPLPIRYGLQDRGDRPGANGYTHRWRVRYTASPQHYYIYFDTAGSIDSVCREGGILHSAFEAFKSGRFMHALYFFLRFWNAQSMYDGRPLETEIECMEIFRFPGIWVPAAALTDDLSDLKIDWPVGYA